MVTHRLPLDVGERMPELLGLVGLVGRLRRRRREVGQAPRRALRGRRRGRGRGRRGRCRGLGGGRLALRVGGGRAARAGARRPDWGEEAVEIQIVLSIALFTFVIGTTQYSATSSAY